MLEYIYQATGILLLAFAVQSFLDKDNAKRFGTAAFWAIYGLTFILGSYVPHWVTGVMVLLLTLIATAGFLGTGVITRRRPMRKGSKVR